MPFAGINRCTLFVVRGRVCFRASESPSQRAPGAGRDGEEGNTENGAAASDSEASSDDDEDEDADVLKMLKHLPNIFIQDALSERYGVLESHLVSVHCCFGETVFRCLRTLLGFL